MQPLSIPNSDRVGMVFCPSWSNVAPIALAYIKGAVRNRTVECHDFNLEFFQEFVPDYRHHMDAAFPEIVPFMGKTPNFEQFEAACTRFEARHRDAVDRWVAKCADYGVVGFSITQESIVASAVLSRRLAALGILRLAGGPSMNMDDGVFTRYFLENGLADVAVLGIAEDVIEPLLDRLYDGAPLDDLPGLMYRSAEGAVRLTAPKPPTLENVYSPPNYDDFQLDAYVHGRSDWCSIYAVIGCMADCEFCTIHEFYPGYKFKSLDQISREMLYLRDRYGITKIFFSDSMFLGRKERAIELFDFAIENGFELAIQIRIMKYWLDEEVVAKAAQCVIFLQIGLESASPQVRRAMGKLVNPEVHDGCFELFFKYKLPLYSNIIVGYPNETEEDFQYTYDFLDRYFQQEKVIGIGMNAMFVPNDFPAERYNIRRDNLGRWYSDTVNVYDRVRRVSKICALAEKHGRDRGTIYYADTVDGIPLMLNSDAPDLDAASLTFIETHGEWVGHIDESQQVGDMVYVTGWARDPANKTAATAVAAVSQDRRVLFSANVGVSRMDVAQVFDEPNSELSGWNMWLETQQFETDAGAVDIYAVSDKNAYLIQRGLSLS